MLNSIAAARPIPEDAPVMIATLSCNIPMIDLLEREPRHRQLMSIAATRFLQFKLLAGFIGTKPNLVKQKFRVVPESLLRKSGDPTSDRVHGSGVADG
jgi:hypothetical protein